VTALRILLAQAKGGSYRFSPPLGLGYLASVLERQGHEIKILDCNLHKDYKKQIVDFQPDVVGLSVFCYNYHASKELSHFTRERLPNCKIISGGPQVTVRPFDMFADDMSDFIIRGEGEYVLKTLIETIQERNDRLEIKSVGYAREGRVHLNEMAQPINDLDSIPFPAVHLFDLKAYSASPQGFVTKRRPFFPMFTSRGCPYSCTFCTIHIFWGRKWRARSATNVVDEIEFLHYQHGVNEIHFQDDNFTLSRQRVLQICREIITRGLEIVWKCPQGVKVDTLDTQLLGLMADSGCYALSLGIESGNQQILDRLNKRLSLEEVARVVRWAKNVGIHTEGFFMLGNPGETRATILQTIKFSKEVDLDAAVFSVLTPFEGTPVFDEYKMKGYLPDLDYLKNWDASEVVINLPGLSSRELETLRRKAHFEFYFRPKIIWRTMTLVRNVYSLRSMIDAVQFIFKGGA